MYDFSNCPLREGSRCPLVKTVSKVGCLLFDCPPESNTTGVKSEDLFEVGEREPDRESDFDSFSTMTEGEIAGITVGTVFLFLSVVLFVLLVRFNRVRFGYWFQRHRANGDFAPAAVLRRLRMFGEGIRLALAIRRYWQLAAERQRQSAEAGVRQARFCTDLPNPSLYPDLNGVEEAQTADTLINQNVDLNRKPVPPRRSSSLAMARVDETAMHSPLSPVSSRTRSKAAGRQLRTCMRPRVPPPATPYQGASRFALCDECGLVHDLERACSAPPAVGVGRARVRFDPAYLRATAPPLSPVLTEGAVRLTDLTVVRRFASDAGINLRGHEGWSSRLAFRALRFGETVSPPSDTSTPIARRALDFSSQFSAESEEDDTPSEVE